MVELMPSGATLADVLSVLPQRKAQLQEMLTSSGWRSVPCSEPDASVEAKSYPNCPISAFRIQGTVPAAAEALWDLQWNMSTEEWRQLDAHLLSRSLVDELSPEVRVYKQTNKLPWPLWNRDSVAVNVREKRADGSFWTVIWSVRHPQAPIDTSQAVETNLHLGAWGFVPVDGQHTRVHRVIQVDPSGNIPAWAVEMNTKQFPSFLSIWRSKFDS